MAKRLKLLGKTILLIALIAVTVTACNPPESEGDNYIFRYDLAENPKTLDPQTAIDDSSKLIITNLFEGLLRMDSTGNITAGAAMEYKKSDDLLTYTFYLRENIFWSDRNGFTAQCTAYDFVFAFRRLFNPEVKSKNAADYFCIENARSVNIGEMSLEELGVEAESEFVLEIRLEEPNANFPILLTASPAFPCNEEYYIQSSGRYGLHPDSVPSNGAFYLKEWVYDPWWTDENRITIRRNNYNDASENIPENAPPPEKVYPSGVNFFINREGAFANFASGKTDCIVTSGGSANELLKKDYSYTGTENSVWGIIPNQDFGDENLRLALGFAIDLDGLGFAELTDSTGYRKADSIIPDGIKIGDDFFRDLVGNADGFTVPIADSASAVSHYKAASAVVSSMTKHPVLIVPADSEHSGIVTFAREIAQQWQEKLSFFCEIKPLPPNEYAKSLADGDYDIALRKFTASYNSPSAILDEFAGRPDISELLRLARQADSHGETARYFREAEVAILQSAELIPICFMTEYFFRAKKSVDLVYNPFTCAIVFKDAKMF